MESGMLSKSPRDLRRTIEIGSPTVIDYRVARVTIYQRGKTASFSLFPRFLRERRISIERILSIDIAVISRHIIDNNTVRVSHWLSRTMRYYVRSLPIHSRIFAHRVSLLSTGDEIRLRDRVVATPDTTPPPEARINPRIGCIQSSTGSGIITMITSLFSLPIGSVFRDDLFERSTRLFGE